MERMLNQPGVHRHELDEVPKNVVEFNTNDESCPSNIPKLKGNSITHITEKIYEQVEKTVNMEKLK